MSVRHVFHSTILPPISQGGSYFREQCLLCRSEPSQRWMLMSSNIIPFYVHQPNFQGQTVSCGRYVPQNKLLSPHSILCTSTQLSAAAMSLKTNFCPHIPFYVHQPNFQGLTVSCGRYVPQNKLLSPHSILCTVTQLSGTDSVLRPLCPSKQTFVPTFHFMYINPTFRDRQCPAAAMSLKTNFCPHIPFYVQ